MNAMTEIVDDLELIRREHGLGASVQSIADKLSRSWDYVARRLRDDYVPSSTAPKLRTAGWPKPKTRPAVAYGKQAYDDVPPEMLARERQGPVLNGNAMAREAQGFSISSTAEACAEHSME